MSRLYWIDVPAAGGLAIMARPRAGDRLDDEVTSWKRSGVNMVVCLLEPDEIVELGLQREGTLCRAAGIEFVSFAVPDRGIPASVHDVMILGWTIASGLSEGRSTAVHCRAGIGRSSLIAACALVYIGVGADRALRLIRRARGINVPDTQEQRDWIFAFEQAHRPVKLFEARG
jgi:protein-tyrosine phosphatase